jgi:hypothetical protein
MGHRWEACPAIMLIEGRGSFGVGSRQAQGGRCVRLTTRAPTSRRAIVAALLKEIHAEADLGEFIRLPGEPQYELRVGWPGGVAKWVIVPEGMIRLASVNQSRGLSSAP